MTTGRPTRVSLGGVALAVAAVSAGTAAGLVYVPVVGSYLGTLVGGFVAGLATEDRLTVASGIAAVLAGLGMLLAGTLPGNGLVDAVLALGSIDPVTLLVSVTLSFAVGAFGAHFGGDLRDGLTEPLEGPAPRRTGRVSTGSREPGTTTTAGTAEVDRDDADGADERATRDGAERPSADREAADLEPDGPE